MTERKGESTKNINYFLQKRAMLSLLSSHLIPLAQQFTQDIPKVTLDPICWDENGVGNWINSGPRFQEGISGKANSFGLLIKWNQQEKPTGSANTITGIEISFDSVIIEADSQGRIDILGADSSGDVTNNWKNKIRHTLALQKALREPMKVLYIKPLAYPISRNIPTHS